MKHQGRAVMRSGDKTDHGGQVISATSETVAMGIAAAIHPHGCAYAASPAAPSL